MCHGCLYLSTLKVVEEVKERVGERLGEKVEVEKEEKVVDGE